MPRHIAIIGAGISGLAAARSFQLSGFAVTVFEKSRGLGGRMSTRRLGDISFDHGAQYFTVRGPRFRQIVDQWQAQGYAEKWFDEAFVGTPGMTAPAQFMARPVDVLNGFRVTAIERSTDGWSVRSESGPAPGEGNGQFCAVIFSIPAPQIADIAGSHLLGCDLTHVQYSPCWALMLAFEKFPQLHEAHLKPDDDVISWIASNGSKPGRRHKPETIVVHATPAWSRANFELAPEQATKAMLERLQRLTKFTESPSVSVAHRWRFALVEQALAQPCVWTDSQGLGACGDWCLGPRIEAAFDSGEAVAAAACTALDAQVKD